MKRPALRLITLVCLLLVAAQASTTATAQTVDAWTSVRSKNFLLVGNASEREIKQVAVRLEQFRSGLLHFFAGANLSTAAPATILVFRSNESYTPFKPLYDGLPANVAGYYQGGTDKNYITIMIEGNKARPYATIFHEYVHLLVENNLRGLPLFLNEGLAEYFSTFELSDKDYKATVGKTNDYHLRILRKKEWLPIADLLAADNKSPLYNEHDKRDLFYAESWALAHYLILGREGEGHEDFYRFVELLAEGNTLEESFKQAFKQDLSTVEGELKEYVKRDKRAVQVTALDKSSEIKDEDLMASAPVTDAEVQYYLGDLLLHTNRLNEADGYLKEALRLNPELSQATAALGMLKVKQKDFTEAIPLLRRAVALAPENYLVHYYYAYGLSRQGMKDDGVEGYDHEAAETMRKELLRAIELAPAFPESYHLLAFINLATNEKLEQAEFLMRRALKLAPVREEFSYVLAQIYDRKRAWAKAREALDPLRRSFNPQLRLRAEAMLKSIAQKEQEFARLEASGIRVPAATDSSDSASVAANRQIFRLPKRFDGVRVRGILTNVECAGGDAVLTLQAGERTLHFHSDNLRRITFVTYVEGLGRSITCGQRRPANLVLLTYRTPKNLQTEFEGEAVAIEFVPEDMDFEP